jgi:hypothetical protein
MTPPRSRAGLLAAVGVALLAGMAVSNPLAAQGIRLDLTAFLVRPNLDARSGEVFARLGRFRTGIGTDLGVGYDVRQFGATLSGGFAGLEIGAPVTRDGIDMGRESGIYRSIALLGHWRPRRRIGRWRPVFSAGYVRSGLDNVLLAGDSLPAYARALGADPPDSVRRPVGIAGSGARFGVSLERAVSAVDFSGRVVVSVEAASDVVRFREVSYAGRRAPIPNPGTALIPRLVVSLRWSPRAAAIAERPVARVGELADVAGLSDGREPTRAVGSTPGGRRSSLNAGRGTRARAGRGNMSGHRG